MNATAKKTTLIVGGGLCGLTAGYLLAKSGKPCLIAERDEQTGGLCRSFVMDGIVFDYGPHVLFVDPETPAGRLVREILSGLELISHRFAFAIQAGGRFWKFPNITDFLFYPWKYQKQALAALIRKRPPLPPGPISAAFELMEKCGPDLYELLFKDLFLKKALLPTEELHHHWLARVDRTVDNALEPHRPGSRAAILRRVMKKLNEKYFYPRAGLSAFPDRIRDLYLEAGGELATSCGEISLETLGGRVGAAVIGGRRVAVDEVVWTAPVNALNAALGEAGRGLPSLPYVSMLLIYLSYSRKKRVKRPYVYTYHPDPALVFNRIYYPESIYRELSPPDREGICLEFNVSEDLRDVPREEILARAVADVERLGLFPAADLREKRLVELPEIMPIYPLDYQERMQASYAAVRGLQNLFAVGRQGGFYFCLTPGAVSQGIKIAERLGAEGRL